MDRSMSRGLRKGRRGWISLALLLLFYSAGCKQDSSTSASEGALKAEVLLSHLKLTGLLRDGSRQWALFLLAVPGKPTEYLKLKAGQRLGDLEVLSIHPPAKTVDVRLGDQTVSLSLATDGVNPEDGYAWLQRLTPDEHARLYNTPARRSLVDEHAQAQEERQREEQARQQDEREELPLPSPGDEPANRN